MIRKLNSVAAVNEAFHDAVGARLKPKGFSRFVDEWGDLHIARKFPGGFQKIGFPILNRYTNFEVSVLASIRLDIVNEFTAKFDDSKFSHPERVTTVQVSPEDFVPDFRDYVVGREAEFTRALDEMLQVLEQQMLPFLDQCIDLAFLERAINGDSGNTLNKLGLWPRHRAMYGVATAYLCGRHDVAELAANYKRDILIGNEALGVPVLDKMLAYIAAEPAQQVK